MKTRILNLQFAFFLRDIIERPDIEFKELNSEMLNVFDAMPKMIPTPRELPSDVPVMMLKSSDDSYICNISRSRVDFILVRNNDEKSNADLLKDFNSKVNGLMKYLLGKQPVVRFGMVARYFQKDNMAARTMQKKYFTSAVDGAEELSIRYNKRSESFGYTINEIHEISALDIVSNGRIEKGTLILKDINNNLNVGKKFDFETLSKLTKKYASNINESEIEGLIR